MAAWWETVLSVGAGGAFAMGGQWVQAHWTTKRERESRQAEREATHLARRQAFELEQLNAMTSALRNVRETLARVSQERDGEPLGSYFFTELDAPLDRLRDEVNRTLDWSVIEAVVAYQDAVRDCMRSRVDGSLDTPDHHFHSAEFEVGKRLRAIYGPDPTQETPA